MTWPAPARRWHYLEYMAFFVWVLALSSLMIADVWEETNGMVAFSTSAPLAEKLTFVFTESLGFWRPLPAAVAVLVLHVVPDFDLSWRILRAVNMAMLVSATTLLLKMICPEGPLRFVTTVALLFSGSAVITAGSYANIFDASALLLMAIGTTLLLRDRAAAAGVVFGIACFCKESAVLSLPFLLMLVAARRITRRQMVRAAIPAVILGAIYFAIRSTIVPFGGAGDVHGFASSQFFPTVVNLAESFWRQSLKRPGPGIVGFLVFALALAALRRPPLIAAALAFHVATSVVYWGMFGVYQDDVVMHYLNMIGRLYLVPVALMLLVLALERRTVAIALLCMPIAAGGIETWRDHARFQRLYKRIYEVAAETSPKPLTVHYPMKPLDDVVRGIRIGDIPEAMVAVEATSATLRASKAPPSDHAAPPR